MSARSALACGCRARANESVSRQTVFSCWEALACWKTGCHGSNSAASGRSEVPAGCGGKLGSGTAARQSSMLNRPGRAPGNPG